MQSVKKTVYTESYSKMSLILTILLKQHFQLHRISFPPSLNNREMRNCETSLEAGMTKIFNVHSEKISVSAFQCNLL